MSESPDRKLAVILHADVVGSTALVQRNEIIAHQRIRNAFDRFSSIIDNYGGLAHEIRGDALVAEFSRASDAVSAALAFQGANRGHNENFTDDLRADVRIGISLGEVVIADGTITGAGVVLAQRLEQLARAGGVVVQGSVADTVPTRLPFEYENLGEQILKGFERAVGAYAVTLGPDGQLPEPDTGRTRSRALPTDKPSVAVLPFADMSGDPEQEYFSDGISEDIITDMSKLSSLVVIARNSSFTYKGTVLKVGEVARDLGVRYVLQGSVRKAGSRVRVTAQLVDAESEQHVWAERYDRDLEDIFALQDELSRNVVAATAARLTEVEHQRLAQRATGNVAAYDKVLRGREQLQRHTKECNARAIELFDSALALDPDYATAYGHLAEAYLQQRQLGWIEATAATLERAREYADRAVELADDLGLGHGVRGQINLWEMRYDEAVDEGERRVALDPGDVEGIATLAMTHAFAGTPERALELIETAMHLDPHYPFWYLHVIGVSRMALEDYVEAIAALERAVALNPHSMPPHMVLAACLALTGEQESAERELAESRRLNPDLSIAFAAELPYRRPQDRDRLVAGLNQAGLRG